MQQALDELLGERLIPDNFLGLHQQYRHETLSFAKLLEQSRNAIEVAPAQYEDLDIGAGEIVRCLKTGFGCGAMSVPPMPSC